MRNFSQTKRIVIKVGTNVLSKGNSVDTNFLRIIAKQVSQLIQKGHQVILVTSGAIGMGRGALNFTTKPKDVKIRQALAAVGQSILMREYQDAFGQYDQVVGQVLLTNRIMSHRKNYLNLKNAMETLLDMKVVPIINENDCVSIDEIDLAFGDNDKLSALVASKIDAELLIVLTDVEGLYDANPRENKNAQLIPVVTEITPEIEAMAGSAGSTFGTGGMTSKLNAIKIAASGGCKSILAHGHIENVITRILDGEEIGTLFLPKRRLSNRKRWILTSLAHGTIDIDKGAVNALNENKSLLFVGISDIKGDFKAGDIIYINAIGKGITKFSATQLRDMLKQKQTDGTAALKSNIAVHKNDMVLY